MPLPHAVAELEELAHKVDISREKVPSWPLDKLTVLAEHSSVIYDLMPDQLIEQVGMRPRRCSACIAPLHIDLHEHLKSCSTRHALFICSVNLLTCQKTMLLCC